MSVRRLIELNYDVNADILRDDNGNELKLSEIPSISYGQHAIVNLQLVTDSDLTAYDQLEATALYEAALDKSFSSAALMCKTLNAGFNVAGEWGEAGTATADPTAGELSFGLNASTSGYNTKIGSDAEVAGTLLELQVSTAAGSLVQVWRFSFRSLGVLNDSGAVPDEMTDNFQWFTDSETGAQGLRVVNDAGEVLETLMPAGV